MVQNQGQQEPEIYNYHLDHLGTPKELSNGAGDIVWHASYSAYGNAAINEAVTDAVPKGQFKEMNIPSATKNAKKKK